MNKRYAMQISHFDQNGPPYITSYLGAFCGSFFLSKAQEILTERFLSVKL